MSIDSVRRGGEVLEIKLDNTAPPSETWAFLKAPRFWVMLAGCIFAYLEVKGFVGEDERNLVLSIATLFVSIRTIDRTVDNLSRGL